MKKFITISILVGLLAAGSSVKAQNQQADYLGLPGDNLNLFAVMELFQASQTLEEFEENLNSENSHINNLDLNGDNFIDYLTVIDYIDGNVHNIILRDAINSRESQDVAVFTVQRFNNGQVQIQLIGDEALYGRDYIVEPIYDDGPVAQTPNPGYTGNVRSNVAVNRTTYVEVDAWPLIRFIFRPNYVVYHSSWRWGYYPTYWHPWPPYYYHYYYGYHYNSYNYYYAHYRHSHTYRYARWNDYYYSNKRMHSVYVNNNIHSGSYKKTYTHPEQRKAGMKFYSKTQKEQNSRRTNNSSVNNQTRRADNSTPQIRQSSATRSTTSRRTTTTETKRNAANSNAGGNQQQAEDRKQELPQKRLQGRNQFSNPVKEPMNQEPPCSQKQRAAALLSVPDRYQLKDPVNPEQQCSQSQKAAALLFAPDRNQVSRTGRKLLLRNQLFKKKNQEAVLQADVPVLPEMPRRLKKRKQQPNQQVKLKIPDGNREVWINREPGEFLLLQEFAFF